MQAFFTKSVLQKKKNIEDGIKSSEVMNQQTEVIGTKMLKSVTSGEIHRIF